MSELNASNLRKEHGNEGPDLVGVTELTSPYFMVPPSGTTAERPENPQKGTLRFNTDIGSLEYYKGDTIGWESIDRKQASANPGTRGFHNGARKSPGYGYVDQIDMYDISTTGNPVDFGDMTTGSADNYEQGSFASAIRGCAYGGRGPGSYMNTIEYITMSTFGNSLNFGDLSAPTVLSAGCADSTRGVRMGGIGPGGTPNLGRNIMEYVTISSTGDATDFGDLADAPALTCAASSPTRGVLLGGAAPNPSYNEDKIQYITIQSAGNAVEFGNLSSTIAYNTGGANRVRGLSAGESNPAVSNVIDYITIATTGNASDFGDLTVARAAAEAGASAVRLVVTGGYSTNYDATMDYVTIMTLGNAIDFGDLSSGSAYSQGFSNAHGGL